MAAPDPMEPYRVVLDEARQPAARPENEAALVADVQGLKAEAECLSRMLRGVVEKYNAFMQASCQDIGGQRQRLAAAEASVADHTVKLQGCETIVLDHGAKLAGAEQVIHGMAQEMQMARARHDALIQDLHDRCQSCEVAVGRL